MHPTPTRRTVLRSALGAAAAAAVAAPAGPANAVEPLNKPNSAGAKIRLGLAAYSLRQFFAAKTAPDNKPWTLADFLDRAAEWGVAGVELTEYYFAKPWSGDEVRQLKRRAFLHGISVIATPMGNSFTMPAGPARERELQRVRDWLDVSAQLASPAVRIFAGKAPADTDEATARRHVVECIESVAEHAAKVGVFLALENHGGVVATPAGLLEIVKAVRSPWVGVNFDSGNFHTADPYGDLALIAPYAVTAQFKVEMFPNNKREPADAERVVKILRDAGYRGWLALEYEAADPPLEAVPRHLDTLRKLLA